ERGGPESLSLSPDGRRLAVTADDSSLRLFDAGTGAWTQLATESPQTKAVAFGPDGSHLAALGADGRLYVWALSAGSSPERRLSLQPPAGGGPQGLPRPPNGIGWIGPNTLAVATSAGTVQALDLDEAAWLRRAETLDVEVATGP
ncbi:MAG: repeat and HMG-box DNA-binding protein 1, partial [Enterovirga sp.]|nr:repeat and HMG-box DNA-binding protein 1 [Enterovirga sp.]